MKKVTFILSSILIIGSGIVLSIQYSHASDDVYTTLTMKSIDAMSREEGETNFGPAKVYPCANGKLHKKLCMCEPGYPACTETDCY